MDHYYKERFHVQQDLIKKIAPLTETGDILISRATKELIDGLWPVYDRGKAQMKGIFEPIQVYSLLKPA